MKVIVLHGEDTQKSFARLQKFIETARARNWEILYDEISLTPSLFGQDRLTIIRDYKILNKKILSKASGTLVVYHEGILNKTFLNSLPKDKKVEEFKLPKILWKFLDNMTVKSFHEVIEREPVEFVFAMIAWKFKKKYVASSSPKTVKIINKLAEIDMDVKSGKTDLVTALDLFFSKQLE